MKPDKLYLVHIGESIRRVELFTSEGEQAFLADIRTQDAVLRNLLVLSESTQRLSSEVTNGSHKLIGEGSPVSAMC